MKRTARSLKDLREREREALMNPRFPFPAETTVLLCNGVQCRIGPESNNSRPISAEGHAVGRLIDGKPCGCTVAWTLPNGNCPCAPNDRTNPITVSALDHQ